MYDQKVQEIKQRKTSEDHFRTGDKIKDSGLPLDKILIKFEEES